MEDLLNCFKSRIHFVSIKQVKLGVYLQFLLFYCWNFIQESEPRQSLHATRPLWPLWVKEQQCTVTAWDPLQCPSSQIRFGSSVSHDEVTAFPQRP